MEWPEVRELSMKDLFDRLVTSEERLATLTAQLNQACLDRDGARIQRARCRCLHDPHCDCLAHEARLAVLTAALERISETMNDRYGRAPLVMLSGVHEIVQAALDAARKGWS